MKGKVWRWDQRDNTKQKGRNRPDCTKKNNTRDDLLASSEWLTWVEGKRKTKGWLRSGQRGKWTQDAQMRCACTNYKGIIRLETRIVRVQDYIHLCTYNIYGSTYIYTHTYNLLELGLGQWVITAWNLLQSKICTHHDMDVHTEEATIKEWVTSNRLYSWWSSCEKWFAVCLGLPSHRTNE